MYNNYISSLKVCFILLLSYGVTWIVSYSFFPNNNPLINTKNVSYLAKIVQQPQQFLALFSGKTEQKIVPFPTDLSSFNSVSKGIYAKEEGGKKITVVKLGEVDMVKYSFIINGKPINVHVPVGSISKEELEKQMIEMNSYAPAN